MFDWNCWLQVLQLGFSSCFIGFHWPTAVYLIIIYHLRLAERNFCDNFEKKTWNPAWNPPFFGTWMFRDTKKSTRGNFASPRFLGEKIWWKVMCKQVAGGSLPSTPQKRITVKLMEVVSSGQWSKPHPGWLGFPFCYATPFYRDSLSYAIIRIPIHQLVFHGSCHW